MTLLRPLLCALVFAAAIAFDWHRLMEMLGQGSHTMAAGWFGIPLGALVIGMGLMTPIVGLVASLLTAFLLRGRELLAVSMAMWRLDPPQASEYARFGQAFFVTSGLLALTFCVVGAMLVAAALLRQPLLGDTA
jgi:hypothetical protein